MMVDRGAAENQAYANGYDAGYKQGFEDARAYYLRYGAVPRWGGKNVVDDVGYKKAFDAMVDALEESIELQSHYAKILNDYDGGTRRTFANVEEWVSRLAELERENDGRRGHG